MICFPNAKINIGLYITEKREDGFHNLETLFYPIPFCDILEVVVHKGPKPYLFHNTGISIEAPPEKISCIQALELLRKQGYDLPPVAIHLHKLIPYGAGLGGGSSDSAFMLKLLNDHLQLKLSTAQLKEYASMLGSDNAFFVDSVPSLGRGRGEVLSPVNLDLKGFYLVLLNPGIPISTQEAYSGINPKKPSYSLQHITSLDINDWKHKISNDFEESIFIKYPQIGSLKEGLYGAEASYASMSGSGSSIYGLFDKKPSLSEGLQKHVVWEGFL